MHLLIAALVSIVLSFSTHAVSGSSDWELEKEEEGIKLKIYTREVSGSSLKEFKGEMIVETTLTTLAALLLDSKAAPEWMHQCEKFEIIERTSPKQALIYFINGAPWPISDRDAVVSSTMSQDPETLVLQVDVEAVTGRLPKNDDYVRIPHMSGFWSFIPLSEGKVKVVYQVHADPGGSLPSWLANSVVVDTPYNTMSNMLKMLTLEKYQLAEIPFIKNNHEQ